MARARFKFNKKTPWYLKEPEGTLEEKVNSFNRMEEVLYKILDYGLKDEIIPPEVLEEERRMLTFCKLGPRAHHFTHNLKGKLTSSDVLYMLTCNRSSKILGEMFGVDGRKVRAIRNGEKDEWYWEYCFVRRIKSRLMTTLKASHIYGTSKFFYSLSKVVSPEKTKILHYTSSQRRAKALRKDIINPKDYDKMIKDGTLDIIYPIEKLDIL
jgi:hypothetical protein